MEKIYYTIESFILSILDFDYLGFLWAFFENLTFESMLNFVILYFFIVWVAIIIWVTRDIINRTNNILYQIISILVVVLWTPLWVVIYLLIRPGKTLFEKYYEEYALDDYVESPIVNKEKKECRCVFCNYEVQSDYKFCPNCRKQLKKECIWCNKELSWKMDFCPFCWIDQDKKVEKILSKTADKNSDIQDVDIKKDDKNKPDEKSKDKDNKTKKSKKLDKEENQENNKK